MKYLLIHDFCNTFFQRAFKEYFKELEMNVIDWNTLFAAMNTQEGNLAYLLLDNNEVIGFIQFRIEQTEHWFITEKFGFVREFWVNPAYRNKGFGKILLTKVEEYFIEQDIHKVLLTTDTAEAFYLKNGYTPSKSYNALNGDSVYSKNLQM